MSNRILLLDNLQESNTTFDSNGALLRNNDSTFS